MNSLLIKSLIFVFLLLLSTNPLTSKDGKMAERVKTLKKIKMLEYMKLDEKTADKLMTVMNDYDAKMDAIFKDLGSISDRLENAVEVAKNKNESILLSNAMIEKYEEMGNTMRKKTQSVRKILSDEDFARFVLFESKFNRELRHKIYKKNKDNE